MPPKLPGFYFDPEKNRYFPLSHEPRNKTGNPTPEKEEILGSNLNKLYHLEQKFIQEREIGHSSFAFPKLCREHASSQVQICKNLHKVDAGGAVQWIKRRLQTAQGEITVGSLIIGPSGLGSPIRVLDLATNSPQSYPKDLEPRGINLFYSLSPRSAAEPDGGNPLLLSALTSSRGMMRSPIRDIHPFTESSEDPSLVDKALLVFMGSGETLDQVRLIRVGSNADAPPVKALASRQTIWASALGSDCRKLSLGHCNGAYLVDMQDWERCQPLCRSDSAVLSQDFDPQGNVVFCGFRNGAISSIDIRQPPPPPMVKLRRWERLRSPKLPKSSSGFWQYCSHTPSMKMASSVCTLMCLRGDEMYLLGSAMDGSVARWDRRMVRSPVVAYEGHVNSHSHIAMALDPSETLLVLGGEDAVVRTWSVGSGKLLNSVSTQQTEPVTSLNTMPNHDMFWRTERTTWLRDPRSFSFWMGTADSLLLARSQI